MAKPHALVVPFPFTGHLNPFMHFTRILASNGFIVTFVMTEFNLERSTDVPFSKNDGMDIRLAALPDGLPPHHGRTTNVIELAQSVTDSIGTPLESLIQRLVVEDPPITCIINDTYVLCTQDLAKRFSIPYVAFSTQSAASYAAMLYVGRGYRPPKEPDGLITCIPGLPQLKQREMNTFLQCYDPADFVFDFLTRPFQRIGEADWIFINTFYELEPETTEALLKEHKISLVGPLLPPSFFTNSLDAKSDTPAIWSEEDDCLKWLDMHPPASVLYVSFGSLAILSPQQFLEFALGLEASQQRFLWVVRKDLISGNSDVFPEGFLDRIRDRACFVSWAPQLRVLKHPSIGGFLTHCGFNSILESISAGIPLLGWAFFSDQRMNCRCIVDSWKVGLGLETDEKGYVTREEVERKAKEMMQSEKGRQARERAREWREKARRAVHEGGSSYHSLELFRQDMVSRVKISSEAWTSTYSHHPKGSLSSP